MAPLPEHLIDYILFNYCTNMCIYCTFALLANDIEAASRLRSTPSGVNAKRRFALLTEKPTMRNIVCSSNYCYIECDNACCRDCAIYCEECDGFYCSEDCFNSNTSKCYWCELCSRWLHH